MFWNLLLAHLLGDFVFQTDWMVSKRDNLWALTLHATIHFVLMLFLVGPARAIVWLYLLLLASIHLVQDRLKNNITNKRTDLVGMGFVIDQALHFAAIWAAIYLIEKTTGIIDLAEKPVGVVISIAYVSITYVWFVIERIFNLSDPDYLQDINNTKFPRMLSRTGLISLFLLIRDRAIAGMAIGFLNPYPQSKFRQRAILTDVSVSLSAMLFLVWALK